MYEALTVYSMKHQKVIILQWHFWLYSQGVHGVKTTQHALALDYVTLSGVMEKLQANIQEDHQLICNFMYSTWKRVSAPAPHKPAWLFAVCV